MLAGQLINPRLALMDRDEKHVTLHPVRHDNRDIKRSPARAQPHPVALIQAASRRQFGAHLYIPFGREADRPPPSAALVGRLEVFEHAAIVQDKVKFGVSLFRRRLPAQGIKTGTSVGEFKALGVK